jgi:hypothetical protein
MEQAGVVALGQDHRACGFACLGIAALAGGSELQQRLRALP